MCAANCHEDNHRHEIDQGSDSTHRRIVAGLKWCGVKRCGVVEVTRLYSNPAQRHITRSAVTSPVVHVSADRNDHHRTPRGSKRGSSARIDEHQATSAAPHGLRLQEARAPGRPRPARSRWLLPRSARAQFVDSRQRLRLRRLGEPTLGLVPGAVIRPLVGRF